jgi:GNAT superfamily N-acetyltransferase
LAEIRAFEPDDAESVVSLLATLTPAFVHTAESLRWRERAEPQRQSWVAAEDGELVGFATSFLQLWTAVQGLVRVSAYVQEDRRRRGIGSALWERALSHARDASKFTTEVENDPAGLAFVEHRGFTQYDSEVITRLDPAARTLEPKPHEGFRVVGLQELGGREQELFEFYGAAGGIPAGAPITFEHFRAFILGTPTLDPPTSVVVLDDDDRVASLSWLLVDHERARAENEWTATLPELRGRRLARLAKLASIKLAAEAGIRVIFTGNDPNNVPMRELNRRLGYEELYIRKDLERRNEE